MPIIENTYAQVKVGVDWENKGFICWDAKPGDPVNMLLDSWSMSGWTDNAQWTYLTWEDGRHTPMNHYWKGTFDMSAHDAYLYLFGQGAYGVPVVPDGYNSVLVEPNTTYTFIIDVDINGPAGNPDARKIAIDFFNAGGTYLSQHNLPMSMSGVNTITFTTPPTAEQFMAEIKFLHGFGNSHTEIIVNSAMLVLGEPATIPAYNVSYDSMYDDVTSRVLRLDTTIGYTDRFSLLPDEGTATIVLNNKDRRFTPRMIGGVQPGALDGNFLDIGKAVFILHRKNTSDEWMRAFVGFVTTLEIITGEYRERQVTIQCEQALKRMDRHMGDIGIVPELTVVDLIRNVYTDGGGFTPYVYPYVTTDMFAPRLDIGILFGVEEAMDLLGTGAAVTNPGINMEWPQSLGDVIRTSVDFDGGAFVVQGDGHSLFIAHDYIVNVGTPYAEWAYGDFSEDVYLYDSNIFNDIKLDFVNQPLNEAGSPIILGTNTLRMNVATDADIIIDYDYNKEAMHGDYSWGNHIGQTITTKKVSDGSTVVGGIGISFQEEYDASGRTDNSNNTGWGTGIRFRLYNYTGFEVDVTVEVNGVGMLPDENAVTTYEDADSVLAYGRRFKSYDNKFVTDNDLAALYMEQKLKQIAHPAQYFKSLVLRPTLAKAAYLDTLLGDVIQLDSEYITATNTLKHLVIGKSVHWEPNSLSIEFALAPIQF